MKTWFCWLALASLLWAIPPVATAQDSMSDDSAAEETTEAAPAPTTMPAAPTQPPERIEATVEQLEQLINAPEEARLGREVDEKEEQTSLFDDKKRIDELLGESPRYVYIPSGTDPMIVPWVRNRVMAAELLSEAKELYSTGRLQDALDKLNLILERFGDSDSVEKTRELKMKIEAEIARRGSDDTQAKVTPGPTPPTLPIWIPENTRGVIYDVNDPKKSSVLIGEYILHPGQAIPSYPGIKVVAIEKSRVTLDYQGQVFQLQVEGN